MNKKLNDTICTIIHCLSNLLILILIFFFAFAAVCAGVATLLDFSFLGLLIAAVATFCWIFLLKYYKEDRL